MLPDIQEQADSYAKDLSEWEAAQDTPQVTKLVALVNTGIKLPELVTTSMEEAEFILSALRVFYPVSPVVRNLALVEFAHTGEVGDTVAIEYEDGKIINGNDVVRVVRLQLPY